MSNGKGDGRRPMAISEDEYADNYDRAMGKGRYAHSPKDDPIETPVAKERKFKMGKPEQLEFAP